MKTVLNYLEATVDLNAEVRLLHPIRLNKPAKAMVTILPDDADEAALLREESLANDWNRREKDKAWAHL